MGLPVHPCCPPTCLGGRTHGGQPQQQPPASLLPCPTTAACSLWVGKVEWKLPCPFYHQLGWKHCRWKEESKFPLSAANTYPTTSHFQVGGQGRRSMSCPPPLHEHGPRTKEVRTDGSTVGGVTCQLTSKWLALRVKQGRVVLVLSS